MMKNAFNFILKALSALEVFMFLSCLFGYIEKQLDKKCMFIFKIYGVTDWLTNKPYCPTSHKVKAIGQWNLVS